MRIGTVIACLAAAACATGFEQNDQFVSIETDTDDAEVFSLLPFSGDVSGGTEVTIRGTGLTDAISVHFGLEPATFYALDSGSLLAITPPAEGPGPVDVRITTEKKALSVPDGFIYTGEGVVVPDEEEEVEEEPPDEIPVDTDEPVDTDVPVVPPGPTIPPGSTVGIVETSFLLSACPSCLSRSANIEQNSLAVFHDPVQISWADWMPALGTCANNLTPPTMPVSTVDVGPTASLTTGTGGVISMARATSASYPTLYDSGFLGQSTLTSNTTWGLQLSGGAWGNLTLPSVVQSVTPFASVVPDPIFYLEPDIFTWPISKTQDFGLNWDAALVGGTTVLMELRFYTPTGAYRSNIMCHATDTGDLWVPAALLSHLVVGDDVMVTLYRQRVSRVALPNGAELDVLYSFGIEGTAYVTP